MSTATVARPVRLATPARWAAALERSATEGIQAYQISSTGQWVVTSSGETATAYATDGVECDCLAFVNGDPICKHRALVLFLTGRLTVGPTLADVVQVVTLDDPDPTTPAPAAALPAPRCLTCDDTRAVEKVSTLRAGVTFRAPCPDCVPSVPSGIFIGRRPCRRCEATGAGLDDAGRFIDCPDCNGSGILPRASRSATFAAERSA